MLNNTRHPPPTPYVKYINSELRTKAVCVYIEYIYEKQPRGHKQSHS